jgi:hypothetical protein
MRGGGHSYESEARNLPEGIDVLENIRRPRERGDPSCVLERLRSFIYLLLSSPASE